MYSTRSEGTSVVAEERIMNLKNGTYMTSISKNVYLDKLDYIVNKYSKTYHRINKM